MYVMYVCVCECMSNMQEAFENFLDEQDGEIRESAYGPLHTRGVYACMYCMYMMYVCDVCECMWNMQEAFDILEYLPTYLHIYIHTYILVQVHNFKLSQAEKIDKYTYMHTYIHTCIHACAGT